MRISDWSSDVCSSDLAADGAALHGGGADLLVAQHAEQLAEALDLLLHHPPECFRRHVAAGHAGAAGGDDAVDFGVRDQPLQGGDDAVAVVGDDGALGHLVAVPCDHLDKAVPRAVRSEEHTSELQSLMRISYAVFCLKTKNIRTT